MLTVDTGRNLSMAAIALATTSLTMMLYPLLDSERNHCDPGPAVNGCEMTLIGLVIGLIAILFGRIAMVFAH